MADLEPVAGFSKRFNRGALRKRNALFELVRDMARADDKAIANVRFRRVLGWATSLSRPQNRSQNGSQQERKHDHV